MLSKPIKNVRKPNKKGPLQAHSARTTLGEGASYGTGYKNPVGKSKDVSSEVMKGGSKARKAPRSLA
jgi:hypothetical protein